jgi:hypothetical protein
MVPMTSGEGKMDIDSKEMRRALSGGVITIVALGLWLGIRAPAKSTTHRAQQAFRISANEAGPRLRLVPRDNFGSAEVRI